MTRDGDRTPAQWYCLLAGAALVLAGALGFIADASFDTGTDVEGSDLLIFEVNGWHNIVHLATGALLLASAPRRVSARFIALAFGLTYGAVAIYGLIAGDNVIGLIPVNGPDHALHVALSLVGILAGVASPGAAPARGDDRDRGSGGGRFDTGEPADVGQRDTGDEEARAGTDVDPLTGRPRDDRTMTSN